MAATVDDGLDAPVDLNTRLAASEPVTVPEVLRSLVKWIRPRHAGDLEGPGDRIRRLAAASADNERLRAWLAAGFADWVATSRRVPLLAEAGILSTRGLFAEIRERLYERVLPSPPRADDMRDAFGWIFDRAVDAQWVEALPRGIWAELAGALGIDTQAGSPLAMSMRHAVADAAEILALRIAAEGSETELLHIDPDAERHDSPFLALQREVATFLAANEAAGGRDLPGRVPPPDHAQVLLEQCLDAVARLRSIGRRRGTSVRVTYLLERIEQQLRRLDLLLRMLASADEAAREQAGRALMREVVRASAMRLSVGEVLQSNLRILAKRVTDNASRTGEHYATGNAAEYLGMMKAAMGAGFIIAFMALAKIEIKALHLPPLVEAALVCADYAVGFVIIHILHFTVATKQPAMTAAMIAASVEETSASRRAPMDGLARLIASVTRTQLVAIFGNVALALPMAMAIALAYAYHAGAPMLPESKVHAMMGELRPISGYALLHAAIAGVWLFVAGVVSGWYDNRCAVLDIPGRMRRSPLLRWMRSARRDRLANYIDGNLGAIMGNAVFGVLLGATGFLGLLLGLPIDIRHVTFSAANLGFATVAGDLAFAAFAETFLFVLMIASVNLVVSFCLALNVAMRARGTTFARAGDLGREVLALLRSNPRDFFLPPRTAA